MRATVCRVAQQARPLVARYANLLEFDILPVPQVVAPSRWPRGADGNHDCLALLGTEAIAEVLALSRGRGAISTRAVVAIQACELQRL